MAEKLVIADGSEKKFDKMKHIAISIVISLVSLLIIGFFLANRTQSDNPVIAAPSVYENDTDLVQLTPSNTSEPVLAASSSPSLSASPKPSESYEGPGVINTNSKNFASGRNVAMLNDGTLVDKSLIDNQNLLDIIDEENGTNTTLEDVAEWIAEDTISMNTFIASHFGWPENEYPSESYGLAQDYMDQLIACLNPSYTFGCPGSIYENFTIKEQQDTIKTSIFANIQYHPAIEGSKQSKELLENWIVIGHPNVSGITAIRVDFTDRIFDNIPASIVASVRAADGNRYLVYMSAGINESGNGYYDVLDIERDS